MVRSFLLALLAAPALASLVPEVRVKIKNGTVVGSSIFGVDTFRGIPFAQPPTGSRRLRPPHYITQSLGTINATNVPTACPQLSSPFNTTGIPTSALLELASDGGTITGQGEDCLTLDVQRPSNLTRASKLPVLFWIYGGGFEGGSTQTYDASNIIVKSINNKEPVIYVAANYRLSAYGFLAGKELAAEHATNLGLRDQRMALEWVAENIENFGGDPTKVTIWGESAGSISVFDQLIINGGDNTYNGQPLFRGAIMDSGTSTATDPVTAPQAQAVYDQVVEAAGCSGNADTLQCLRSVPYATFQNASNSLPGIFSYRSLDLAYLPRPDPGDSFFSQSPELPLESGKYTKVPVIIGDQEDEGTLFSLVQQNITTNAQLITYLSSYFPGNPNATELITGLLKLYPNEPHIGQPSGSPFRTGSANNFYPQFKRLAAVSGDLTFTLTRRNVLSILSTTQTAFSYLDSYLYGTAYLGTFHGSDVLVDYGENGNFAGPSSAVETYYINFINNLNPNVGYQNQSYIHWPKYTASSPMLVNFQATNDVLLPDTFRMNASEYLRDHASEFRV